MADYRKISDLVEQTLEPVIDIVLDDEQEEQLVHILENLHQQAKDVTLKADTVLDRLIANIKARRNTETEGFQEW